MTVRKGISGGGSTQRADFWTKCPEVASGHNDLKLWGACQCRNTPQKWGRKPFREERQKRKMEGRMIENPYKRLPPLERRPDGSLYRMTPAQRKRATALIRRECCNCEGGNCIALDDGDTCTCPQTISYSVCCVWFRWAVLPLDGTLEAGIFRDKDLKRCAVCGGVFVPKSNRAKYCPGLRRQSSQAAENRK